MNINNFNKIIKQKFPLENWEGKVEDERKQPIIPASTIYKSVVGMVLFGQKSLLEVDLFNRLPPILKWYQSSRSMVVSDSTIERSLAGYNCDRLEEILGEGYKILKDEGILWVVLPSGRKLSVGMVDGSEFGRFPGVVLLIPGGVNVAMDVELYSKGKELEASKKVLLRSKEKFGKNFVDIIDADGLYLNEGHFLFCKQEIGCDVIVKTEDERLTIIQDAKGLFFGMKEEVGDGIEGVEGVDVKRNISYEIIACGGFKWQGLPFELKVAYVKEIHLKPIKGRPEVEEFWIITTELSLSGEDMRELVHLRWEIENNVFKRLNSLVRSKRVITHKARVRKALLLLWFIGLILLGYYIMQRKLSGEKRYPKESWKWITQLLLFSVNLFSLSSS